MYIIGGICFADRDNVINIFLLCFAALVVYTTLMSDFNN